MLTVCWSAKGGSGATVVTCAMALLTARHRATSMLVDLAGDVPAVLGVAEPPGPGVHNWVAASTNPASALGAIGTTVNDSLRLVSAGTMRAPIDHPRWAELGDHLADLDCEVLIDAGSAPPPGLLAAAGQNLLVTRACYIALRHAHASSVRPSGVVLIREPGHSMTAIDVSVAVGAPVVAEVDFDPSIGQAVDHGLLASRLPRRLAKDLREVAA